ncbi:MAG TPA: PP2C family protein-serine/threonine phosphatase [Candidatus Saccharimonadaceae bacterium]|jgi:sigma-B regulation protein RsbU (phosphoserine phosphatase)|nr:PP2C family protein-serine/threonine phosphatase [Candidatus Saccharimonadaceae bacterium]
MSRPPRPRTAWTELAKSVLWIPLYALPFGAFFSLLGGGRWRDFPAYYEVSAIFSASILLTLWVGEWFLEPRMLPRPAEGRRPVPPIIAFHGSLAIVGSVVGALIVRATLVPAFLGSGRGIVVFLVFTLLFCALFMGLAMASRFYRDSIERARAEGEMNQARRIQRSFLITQFPTRPRLEVHALNLSSRQVSGDFYDVVPARDDAFLVAIADVAGKGVPAALLSSMLQASLRTQAHSIPSVAAIMGNINRMVYRSTTVQQFATFFLARIDERRMRLAFTNAGHNFPLVFRRGGERVTLERGGTVVGVLENAAFEEGELELCAGDRVVMYTDGVSEAANVTGELFGEERLIALIDALPADLPARDVVDRILEGVRAFLDGVEAGDDITVMVLRVLDAPAV